jgi:2Fe-2S ferredoxin
MDSAGLETVVDAQLNKSVMQNAVEQMVPGILGDCGGSCSCATCHVYIDPAWLDKLPAIGKDEEMMLECALDVQENSRLSCQIIMQAELDGIVVRTPERQ